MQMWERVIPNREREGKGRELGMRRVLRMRAASDSSAWQRVIGGRQGLDSGSGLSVKVSTPWL